MILISVKSEIYNDKRQFETDSLAFKFLTLVANIHLLSRLQKVGKKPKRKDFKTGNRKLSKRLHEQAVKTWEGDLLSGVLSHLGSEIVEIYWQAPDKAILINEPGDTENFAMVMAMVKD